MGWTPHTTEELIKAGVDMSPDNMPFTIVYPNADGTTGGANPNYTPPDYQSSDPYGGTPINITSGNSGAGLQSLSATLGSGFQGLFDLIMQNTDKNNAWSAAQAQKQMDFQERMQGIAMDFNSLEAAKNREWQEMMSNTAHQREVADLKAAGLNPVLSASGGNGAAVGSGATAAGVQGMSGAKADADQSRNAALASLYGALISAQTQMYNSNLAAQTNMYVADRQVEASMYGAQLAANANMYGSQMAYNASTYGSDQNLLNNREQRAWNAEHPNNLYQVANSMRDSNSSWSQGGLPEVINRTSNLLTGITNAVSSAKQNIKDFAGYLSGKGAKQKY